jgi:hypothetical protein
LDLLRLPHQIGGSILISPQSATGLVGEQSDNHRGNRANTPRAEPPQRAPVEFIFLGQESSQPTSGIIA